MRHFQTYTIHCTHCTLRKAMNSIIPKITKASHPNMRNAYKTKYTSK
jgi:hypothetical protein